MSNEPGTWKQGVFSEGPEVREYDGQGMRRLIALARDSEQARRIRDALRAVEEKQLPALPEPLPPAECVDGQARRYLSELYGFLFEVVGFSDQDVPRPPWNSIP